MGECLKKDGWRLEPPLWTMLFTVGQDFMLGNCLLGVVKLTTNADPDRYMATVSLKFGHCSASASLKIWWIIMHEH